MEEQQKQERLRASSLLSPQRQYENKQRYIEQHKEKILKAQGRVKSHSEQLAKLEAKIKDDQLKIAEWGTRMEEAESERDELWKLTNPSPAPNGPEQGSNAMGVQQPSEPQPVALSFDVLLAQLKEHAQSEVQAGNEKLAPLLQSINRELFIAIEAKQNPSPNDAGGEGTSGFGPARVKQTERTQPYEGPNETEHVSG